MRSTSESYNGGKSGNGTYQTIINHIPPHDLYAELFAGHAGVFRKIRRAAFSILNDINPEVMQRWENSTSLKDCLVCQDYRQGNLFNKREAKPVVILKNTHYKYIIQKLTTANSAFLYLDPPYLMETRKSTQKLYGAFDWPDIRPHEELLAQIKHIAVNTMISSYGNSLYDSELKAWNKTKFNSTTRRGVREETIYFNYDPPTILHDFSYLGADYRERERIKRKVVRFEEKIKRLPAMERTAILSRIIATNNAAVRNLTGI
jgi:DNA adenine methylase